MNKVKELFYYWPTMLVVLVILYATMVSHPVGADSLPAIPHIDKLIHAGMMGGLIGALAFDWQRNNRDHRLTSALMWTLFGVVMSFSIFDEIFQGLLSNGRSADPWDFVADCIGAITAVYLAPPVIRQVLSIKAKA